MSPSSTPIRTRSPSMASVRRSSVVLPAPGADIRLTVRTPWAVQLGTIGRRDAVVLVEDALENLDTRTAGLGVPAVIADVTTPTVLS